MKYFRVTENNGTMRILKAKTHLELIKQYDLATKQHINTTIRELEGEQLAIAISNDQE